MSVRPAAFNANGSIDVVHDDSPDGHGGTIPAGQIVASLFVQYPGAATADHRALALTCPVCGAVSIHPIGGGAAPAEVQELFVRVVRRLGCPCGKMPANRPVPLVQAHVKLETEKLDGAGRWRAGTLT